MARVRATAHTALPAASALRLWTDTSRWPTFIDGFGHVLKRDDAWPERGAKLVWQSGPAGRGRVTERVTENAPEAFATEIFEERMTGIQRVAFEPDPDGSIAVLELDYTLVSGGPLRGLTDVLFIRRAVTMALERTLERFSREAAEEAAL